MIVQVAGGVFGIHHIEGIVGILFRRVGDDVPFSLLRYNVGYKCLASVEIVADLFHFVFGTSLRKYGKPELLSD